MIKNIRKICIGIPTIAIVTVGMLLISNNVYMRMEYRNWAEEYLSKRYAEKMNISHIYFDQWGWSAKASPEYNADLVFTIKAKYSDTYLERSLESEAENYINNQFPRYTVSARMSSIEGVKEVYPELYELYKRKKRPATWLEVPEYIQLEKLRIDTNQCVNGDLKNDIVKAISSSNIRTSIIEVYDGNSMLVLQFNDVNKTYEVIK